MERVNHDGVLVVGAGLAGLSAALAAAPRKALVLTGAPLAQGCSSAWADRKSTRLNSSHVKRSRMPSSA